MNSLLKQIDSTKDSTSENYLSVFEASVAKIENATEAELLMKKLQYLGLNFDPFAQDVSTECQQVMDNLGLSKHLKNPYLATNILLRLLDKTEEQLNKLKQ